MCVTFSIIASCLAGMPVISNAIDVDYDMLTSSDMVMHHFEFNKDCDYYDWPDDASVHNSIKKTVEDGVLTISTSTKFKIMPLTSNYVIDNQDWYYVTFSYKTDGTTQDVEKFGNIMSTGLESDAGDNLFVRSILRSENKVANGQNEVYPGRGVSWSTTQKPHCFNAFKRWVKYEYYFNY